jgi:hypothetical protein
MWLRTWQQVRCFPWEDNCPESCAHIRSENAPSSLSSGFERVSLRPLQGKGGSQKKKRIGDDIREVTVARA